MKGCVQAWMGTLCTLCHLGHQANFKQCTRSDKLCVSRANLTIVAKRQARTEGSTPYSC